MSSPFQESKKLGRELQQTEQEFKTGINERVTVPDAAGNNVEVTLQPAKYFEADPYDSYAQAKQNVTNRSTAGNPLLGNKIEVTEKDLKWLLGQETKTELVNFEKWFYTTLKPGSDPNKLKLARDLYPAFFERRAEEIRRQVDICKKLARIGLRGPQSEEEIKILYLLDQGRITPPNLDLLFPSKAKAVVNIAAENKLRGIDQGYWNPRKYTKDYQVKTRNLDTQGMPFLKTRGIVGNAQTNLAGQAPEDSTTLWGRFMG